MEQHVGAGGRSADGEKPTQRSVTADEARDTLARRYGIGSMFVRVAQLSNILGIAAPTIYSAMREGRFFLPHRMLCSMPVVRLDDLAEWYSRNDSPQPTARRQAGERGAADAEKERPAPLSPETREQIIARALARAAAANRSEGRVAPSGGDGSAPDACSPRGRRIRPSR